MYSWIHENFRGNVITINNSLKVMYTPEATWRCLALYLNGNKESEDGKFNLWLREV